MSRKLTCFNEFLKLATDAKLTVAGNEFHTFTILFAKNTDLHWPLAPSSINLVQKKLGW